MQMSIKMLTLVAALATPSLASSKVSTDPNLMRMHIKRDGSQLGMDKENENAELSDVGTETREQVILASQQSTNEMETYAHGKTLRLKTPDPSYSKSHKGGAASNMRAFHLHFPLTVQLTGLVETQGADGLSDEDLERIGQASLVLNITETVPAMTNEDGKEVLTEVPCVGKDGTEHACSSDAYTTAGVYACPESPAGTNVDEYVNVATCSHVPSMLESKLPKTVIFAHAPMHQRKDVLEQMVTMAVKLGSGAKMIVPHAFYNDVISALDMPQRGSVLEGESGSVNIYRHTCKWTMPCGNRRRVTFCWPVCCGGSPCR